MIKKIIKKIFAMLILILTLFGTIIPSIYATEISSAYLQNRGEVERHLQYWNETTNAWHYIVTTYVTYNVDGREYPAYCLNKEYNGVGEHVEYSVDVDSDVNDVLGDIRVWRTIINGFPYKSAGELGLENDLEAFQATKQAVYCIIYDFDPISRYRGAEDGADSRGDAIKNAIVNLVNIGRYGSQTPADPSITLTASGNFEEDGDYYTQKINVSSIVDMANYWVIDIANLPEGTIITNASGTITNSFTGNESMYVKIPKSKMVQDIQNATINVQGECKTYPVFYGRTSIAGTQNYALTYSPFSIGIGNLALDIKANTGKIIVNKIDNETKAPIEGVKFLLEKMDGTVIGTAITDKDGLATFDKLYQGNYKLIEEEANPKYILNKAEFDVFVEYNKTTTIEVENEAIKGQIEITKVSKDDNKITGDKKGTPLQGAIFKVYNSNNKVVDTLTTDSKGKAISKLLRKGKYYIKEVDSGSVYYLVDSNIFEAEIKENKQIVKINVEDESLDLDIEVEKTGFVETQSKDNIYYNFKNIRNKSNVKLNNFTWQDTLPTQALRVDKIYTGTWNEDLEYSIWYKTNKNDFQMLVDKLSTKVNNEVRFKTAELEEDEFITEYEFRFGTVKIGFSEEEPPILYCDMLDGLGNGFVFTNHTKVLENYKDEYVEDTDKWTTITYFKEIEKIEKLPRTGC